MSAVSGLRTRPHGGATASTGQRGGIGSHGQVAEATGDKAKGFFDLTHRNNQFYRKAARADCRREWRSVAGSRELIGEIATRKRKG